ncbi:Pycsar system effector family protein [Spirosoma soli]|uniref:Pycsar system effector family protein n=1 Tax=Spirosoma soli TaxID=1770529 RepID=A0ABW5M7X3_9BACT
MKNALLAATEAYVIKYFDEHANPALTYHTLTHTQDVVHMAKQLAHHYDLVETPYLTVLIAAWFHDVGYLMGPPEQHEQNGATLAAAFLREHAASPDLIKQVQRCILATKMPQSPQNLLEEILCDADMSNLGSDGYQDRQKLLRKEKEYLSGQEISGRDWRQANINLLTTHRYFTAHAQELLAKGQANNLRRLQEKQAEKLKEDNKHGVSPLSTEQLTAQPAEPVHPTKEKKPKDGRSDRGIETMFRTTSTNHLQLSEIADSKANIMISVNSIMVSVIVSILPRRIEENPYLITPTALFLTTSLLTIIFAILATRPNVTEGTFSKETIQKKQGNLLFFGNFHDMSLADYEWGINELMNDSNYLYSTMTRDIYYLGKVLAKKYKLLRIAYNTFMFGFVVSILAFLIVFLFFTK